MPAPAPYPASEAIPSLWLVAPLRKRSSAGFRFVAEVTRLLTEQEVARSWRNLFNSPDFGEETFRKAERLLEELRPESPLRHRLAQELAELRKIRAQRKKSAARQKVSH
ncbi:MAG TPA: hypothetical protein PK777_15045 [Thermoguttaceae bacterium]|nr:hypothetical protein [Thermoguttaceae bacterium]HPP54267.1 hypothetical protein [Thermoguttaceae bacterium]